MCDHVGERLAIKEFNETHETRKLAPAYYLLAGKIVKPWYHSIRIAHLLNHSRYGEYIGKDTSELALSRV